MLLLKQLESAIESLGYAKRLIRRSYDFADFSPSGARVGQAVLAVFSTTPCSYRNACIGVVKADQHSGSREKLVMRHRSLGAPLVFLIVDGRIEPWAVSPANAALAGEAFDVADIDKVFKRHRDVWGPEGIGRLKSHIAIKPDRQLALFNTGLVPVLAKFFQSSLKELLERAFSDTAQSYQKTHGELPPITFLFPYLFRFVTAKIFIDRGDVHGWSELTTPRQILEKAEKHAGSGLLQQLPREFLHKAVLEQAWHSVSSSLHFQNLSVPDLAFVYESSFINEKTRRELGVHSTPEPLANFIVQRLDWSRVPVDRRVVFEPFSGHSIFLACALARMADDLSDSMTSKQRHEYFKRRLIGVEKDPLAREVARLVLTLADYPNEDGWQLYRDDVFTWPDWESTLEKATVVLANPPYESFDPAERKSIGGTKSTPPSEFLHRLLKSPPELLGLVLPQSFLSSPFYQAANRQLAELYSDIEIVELPRVFQHADNETIALMAQGLRDTGKSMTVRYSEVPAHKADEFLQDYRLFNRRTAKVSTASSDERAFTLWIPPKDSLFEQLEVCQVLGSVATPHQGLHWKPRTDEKSRSELRDDVASDRPKKGFIRGCEKMAGNLSQFHLRHLRFLSIRKEDHHPKDIAFSYPWTQQKVICNRSRFERHAPWRLASFADDEGITCTQQFLAIWPHDGISVFTLAAILSSPVANNFSFIHDLGADNHVSTLLRLPLPSLDQMKLGGVLDRLAKKTQKLIQAEHDKGLINEAKIKEAIIRLDAAVLDAYGLTAHQQRQLLDQFAGWKRPVCVEFDRYFPKHFKDVITLSDFVAIQFDWDTTNERRCDLIDKEYSKARLTTDERHELDHLQHLADLLIRLKAPYESDGADELIVKLKASGKWIE